LRTTGRSGHDRRREERDVVEEGGERDMIADGEERDMRTTGRSGT
jgi:hypothetical protein